MEGFEFQQAIFDNCPVLHFLNCTEFERTHGKDFGDLVQHGNFLDSQLPSNISEIPTINDHRGSIKVQAPLGGAG